MPKVFISYSHDSPEHSARVLEFANALRGHGVDAESSTSTTCARSTVGRTGARPALNLLSFILRAGMHPRCS